MTWRQWQVARQHLTEERIGKLLREVKHHEDAAFSSAVSKLR